MNKLLIKGDINYNQARDLGISYTAAASRPSELSRARFIKTRERIQKNKQIANISRMAKKLYAGSCFSASTWGHQSAGVTTNEMIAIERNALACSGVSPRGRCRLVSLSVIYGPGGTPQARIVKDTLKVWFQVLALNPVDANHLNQAWAKARRFLYTQKKPQQHVLSIMSNVITILISAKWMPYSPNRWGDPKGDHWLIDPEANCQVVSTAIIKDLHDMQLQRALGHYDGSGI